MPRETLMSVFVTKMKDLAPAASLDHAGGSHDIPSKLWSLRGGPMKASLKALLLIALAVPGAGCSGPSGVVDKDGGGQGRVVLDGTTYEVKDVEMTIALGEDPYFQLGGDPVAHEREDCVPGLSGGLGLYGDLPSSVREPVDLVGQRLRVDFTGD